MNFEILHHETLLEGRAFNVQRVTARLPDDSVRHYDLVDHRSAVVLVPIDEQGRIWFVRQYRIGAAQILLELPAGVLEDGEDPQAGAHREIREEIGLAAGRLEKLGGMFPTPGYCNEYLHVYLASELYPAPLKADADEFLAAEAIPAERVYQMIYNGEICDGKTIAALLMVQPFLKRS